MVTGVAIVATATMLIFPPFRGSAQKSKRDTTQKEDGDSTTGKRKSLTVDRNIRSFRIDNAGLEKSMAELNKALAELDKQDFGKIGETIENALKAVDMDKIGLEVEQAMKNVDMKKIQAEIDRAMKEVDITKIKAEAEKAMKEVDWKGIQKEMETAMVEVKESLAEMKKVNMDEVRAEMDKAKAEIAKSKIGMKEEMQKAKAELEKAKVQLGQMKEMLTELEKDGLVKKGEKMNINWKNGKLYINDKEQPQSVTDKYKKYMDLNIISDQDDDDNDLK